MYDVTKSLEQIYSVAVMFSSGLFRPWQTTVYSGTWLTLSTSVRFSNSALSSKRVFMVVLITGHNSPLTEWLTDYDGVRLCLRTAATIVHPPGDMWTWRAMVVIMPTGDNSWLVHQSSLAVLPADTSGVSMRNGRREWEFLPINISNTSRDFKMP
jgi:hypothetical protein